MTYTSQPSPNYRVHIFPLPESHVKAPERDPHSYLINRTPDLSDNLTQQKSLDRKNTRNYGYILSPFILGEAVYLTWSVNIQCSLKVVVLCILVFFGTL